MCVYVVFVRERKETVRERGRRRERENKKERNKDIDEEEKESENEFIIGIIEQLSLNERKQFKFDLTCWT